MTCWYEGPLAAFDTETTGVDVETDRIVSAAVVVQDAPGTRPRAVRWLVNPGVPVPAGATAIHGLTDEHLQRNGRWPAPVMREIADELAEQAAMGRPLVVMNAPFDLTLLDRELRRRSRVLAGPVVRVDAPAGPGPPGPRQTPGPLPQGPPHSHRPVRALRRRVGGRARRGRGRAGLPGGGPRPGPPLRDPPGTPVPGRAAHPAVDVARGPGTRSPGVVRAQRHPGVGGPVVATAPGPDGGGRITAQAQQKAGPLLRTGLSRWAILGSNQ